jgi:hypothetical protein
MRTAIRPFAAGALAACFTALSFSAVAQQAQSGPAPEDLRAASAKAIPVGKQCFRMTLSDIQVGREETIRSARQKLTDEYAPFAAKERKLKGKLSGPTNEAVRCEDYLWLPLIGQEYKCFLTATYTAGVVSGAAAQQARPTDLAVFERWGLFGTWGVDCNSEAEELPDGRSNWRIVYERNPDGSQTARSTTRRGASPQIQFQSVISEPVIAGSGNLVSRYRSRPEEPGIVVSSEKSSGGNLMRTTNSHPFGEPDKPLISLGKFVASGEATPWIERCK